MLDFEFQEPATLEAALHLLHRYGREASLVAGSTFLTPRLRSGQLDSRALISLHRLPELAQVEALPGQALRLGAMVTHRTIETSRLVREICPLLSQACGEVANVRFRCQATLGGNLVAAHHTSDPPVALMALGASVRLLRAGGERLLPVREFITGIHQTALQPQELLAEIIVPPLPAGARPVYLKFKTRSSEDRSCLTVAATASFDGAGNCRDLRLVIGAATPCPQVMDQIAGLARGRRLSRELVEDIAQACSRAIEPIDDQRGSAWYRRQLIPVLVRRALVTLSSHNLGEQP